MTKFEYYKQLATDRRNDFARIPSRFLNEIGSNEKKQWDFLWQTYNSSASMDEVITKIVKVLSDPFNKDIEKIGLSKYLEEILKRCIVEEL